MKIKKFGLLHNFTIAFRLFAFAFCTFAFCTFAFCTFAFCTFAKSKGAKSKGAKSKGAKEGRGATRQKQKIGQVGTTLREPHEL